MTATNRDLEVLLMIVGVVDGMALRESQIAEAFQVGAITPAEGAMLQRYARLSPPGRKAAATQPRDVSDAEIERAKAKMRGALDAKAWHDKKRAEIDEAPDISEEDRAQLHRILDQRFREKVLDAARTTPRSGKRTQTQMRADLDADRY